MKKIYGGKLRLGDEGKAVTLYGWIANKRKFKNQLFIDFRDSSGLVQLVFHDVSDPLLTKESCLKITGEVKKRLEANLEIPSGEVEVHVKEYEILNSSKQIPFEVNKTNSANEDLRLEYRFLDLRQEKMLANLKLRHKLLLEIRNYFDKSNFIEVETPILCKSTPEGARDYLVPTRRKGKFFALPQSPQLYKQLLMASGVERYFQIARVFRDEDLRKDRQPEFTQLDIEMSFGGMEELFSICEDMWKETLGNLGYKIKTPFKHMDYFYSMAHYGNDKPDTRYEFLINDLGDSLGAFYPKNTFIKAIFFDRNIDDNLSLVKEIFQKNQGEQLEVINLNANKSQDKKLDIIKEMAKSQGIANPTIIISSGVKEENALKALGAVRVTLNELYRLANEDELNFLWIVNWPMFEFDEESQTWAPAHHAFTQFDESTVKYLETKEYSKVRAKSYDLVLNGFELGSGSIRIHDPEVQKKMFNVLNLSPKEQQNKFGFFLKAFDYGLPPHNGVAFGIERVLMILTKSASIRDVIAFPKNAKGLDLLSASPSEVLDSQLKEYGLKLE
ncbi:lysyl-tRNA synthetase [Metamycoplasma arthritidis]|uniref:Aspartate--tRNA ligase n=1 Tax=Metamycoplasma arthritidis (strain 158L3-1) TaxID=243272 RepID=B3PMK7_META1|nr:aspartate--tRNA ligase [Metamycoplasma arthritidis]ACF07259.1 aspartyl-tRNA synthetase [Metamycoplasma arthritidis 158L3-1]VEU78782.1 lysyl-tRNA synthetase [Metamycoplasma arthritidis]